MPHVSKVGWGMTTIPGDSWIVFKSDELSGIYRLKRRLSRSIDSLGASCGKSVQRALGGPAAVWIIG